MEVNYEVMITYTHNPQLSYTHNPQMNETAFTNIIPQTETKL